MQLDKYQKKRKEYLKLKRECAEHGYYGRGRFKFYDTGRPITFVPLEEKEFAGWNISVELKLGYIIQEALVIKIIDWFLQNDLTRNNRLIRFLRSHSRSFANCQKQILKFFYNKRIHAYELPSYVLHREGYSDHSYKRFMETLSEDERALAKFFFIKYTSLTKGIRYELRTSYDSHQNHHVPVNLLYYKITKSYITEIGMLDREWEQNAAEIRDAYFSYKYVEQSRYSRYRNDEIRRFQKAINNSYTSMFKELRKYENVADQDIHLFEAQRCKFFRRPYFKHKWNF